MRILIVHNFYQHAGGEDVVFQQEVEELSKSHEVQVYTCKNSKGLKGAMQFLSYPFNLNIARRIIKVFHQFKPDVVHIHNLHYGIGPYVIRRLAKEKIPIVQTLHNFRLLCPSASLFFQGKIFTESLRQDFPWKAVQLRVLDSSLLKTFITAFTYWIHRKLGTWNKVDRFLVLSDFARSLFEQSTFPVSIDRFIVRPNALMSTPKTMQRTENFVYIGRLSEEKGILPLLHAFADLPFSLDIYGTGPLLQQVTDLAARHSNIHYKGFQPQSVLTDAICSASALIVPSVCYEGMPMTIIEAFAQGTPVLASNIGILGEMVVPLYTGMNFDPFDKLSIQHTLATWASMDQATKMSIAAHCKEVYKQRYTLEESMARLTAIYSAVIQEKKGEDKQ